jgi:hypothetical protein
MLMYFQTMHIIIITCQTSNVQIIMNTLLTNQFQIYL